MCPLIPTTRGRGRKLPPQNSRHLLTNSPVGHEYETSRPYEANPVKEAVKLCTKRLRFPSKNFEISEDYSILLQSSRLLESADQICFLGFSFNERNLERVGISRGARDKRIIGTAYGLSESDRARVIKSIPNIKLGAPTQMIYDFLADPKFDLRVID